MAEVCNPEQEADCVEDVALAGTVEAGDGVEGLEQKKKQMERKFESCSRIGHRCVCSLNYLIESVDLCPLSVGLEPVDDDRLDVHLVPFCLSLKTILSFVQRQSPSTLNQNYCSRFCSPRFCPLILFFLSNELAAKQQQQRGGKGTRITRGEKEEDLRAKRFEKSRKTKN